MTTAKSSGSQLLRCLVSNEHQSVCQSINQDYLTDIIRNDMLVVIEKYICSIKDHQSSITQSSSAKEESKKFHTFSRHTVCIYHFILINLWITLSIKVLPLSRKQYVWKIRSGSVSSHPSHANWDRDRTAPGRHNTKRPTRLDIRLQWCTASAAASPASAPTEAPPPTGPATRSARWNRACPLPHSRAKCVEQDATTFSFHNSNQPSLAQQGPIYKVLKYSVHLTPAHFWISNPSKCSTI